MSGETSSKIRKDDKFMEIFWELAEPGLSIRIAATGKLVNYLNDKQKQVPADGEQSEELQYTSERLVQGLASSRKWARQGFILALSQVLKKHACISVDDLLSIVDKSRKQARHGTPQEQRNACYGELSLYLALVRSDRIQQASGSVLETIMKNLIKFRNKNISGSHMLCTQIMVDISQKVSSKKFGRHIWTELDTTLSCGWEECTADVLYLLLKLRKVHPKTINDQFLHTNWGNITIIHKEMFDRVGEILKKSTDDHPVIHPVCFEILNITIEDDIFLDFWNDVICEQMINRNTQHRYLALKLMEHSLKENTNKHMVKGIMCSKAVQMWLNTCSHKTDVLYALAETLISTVIDIIKASPGSIQIVAVKVLLNCPALLLTNTVHTKILAGLFLSLTEDATKKFTKLLMNISLGRKTLKEDNVDVEKRWAVGQLRNFLRSSSVAKDQEFKINIIKFLFLHSYFDIEETSPLLLHCSHEPTSQHTATDHNMFHMALWKALNNLAASDPHQESVNSPTIFIDTLYSLAEYTQTLLASPDNVSLTMNWTDNIKTTWTSVLHSVNAIRKDRTASTKIFKNGFQLLFLCLAFQLFEDSKAIVPVIEDLHICHEKALETTGKVERSDGGETEWVGVMTEIIVSLLSRDSLHLRHVSSLVFHVLSAHLGHGAVKIVLDVVKPIHDDNEEEKQVEFENSDDNEEEQDNEMEVESDQKMKDEHNEAVSSSDSEESKDSEAEDEGAGVDQRFRADIQAALGPAVATEGGETDSDMDDEQMFRIDSVLADVFKKRGKKTDKEKKKQLLCFKLRCLDLLDIIVKHPPSLAILLDLLKPLLVIIEFGIKDKEQKLLGEKASNILHHICKPRKVPKATEEDNDRIPILFQEFVTYSTQVMGIPLVKDISNVYGFLLKVGSGGEDEGSTNTSVSKPQQEIIKIVSHELKSFFEKRDSHLNSLLFRNILQRQPQIFWPLEGTLLQYAQDANVRVFCRTQSVSMLYYLLNKNTFSNLSPQDMENFNGRFENCISQISSEIQAESVKSKFLLEVLEVLHRYLTLSHMDIGRSLVTKLEEIKGNLNKDCRKMLNKIAGIHANNKKRQLEAKSDSVIPKKKKKSK